MATFVSLWNVPLQLQHSEGHLFSCRNHPFFNSSTPLRGSRRLSVPFSGKFNRPLVVVAAQSNIVKTVLKVGKDGIEAATNVPDPVPRPIARAGVTVAVVAIYLFVLKSVLSTAFFVLASSMKASKFKIRAI